MLGTELKSHPSAMEQTSYVMTFSHPCLTVDLNQQFRDENVWMSSAIP